MHHCFEKKKKRIKRLFRVIGTGWEERLWEKRTIEILRATKKLKLAGYLMYQSFGIEYLIANKTKFQDTLPKKSSLLMLAQSLTLVSLSLLWHIQDTFSIGTE